MFTWLKNLFARKNGTEVYAPDERLIYRYFNGEKVIAADPLVLFKRMKDVFTDLMVDMQVANSESKDADLCHAKAIAKIRGIFSINPLDENGVGLTDTEALDLFEHFYDWIDGLKKNSRMTATSTTEAFPASKTPSAAEPTIPNGSASGSTASDNSTAVPVPSP